MKLALALITLTLAGCESLPIKGKVCYAHGNGEVCAESDGTALFVTGTVKVGANK
jgi:hypothetical protein